MKKIFLYAYDRQNLGDDLFVHTIANRYPNAKIYMWSDAENKNTFKSLENLKVIDRDSRFVRFLNKIRPSLVARYKAWHEKRCDAVVYIGGSIFIEYPNWEQLCTWWEWTSENRPFYVLGANFGPYHTEAYRERMADIFSKMQDICFRDHYSYDLFNDIDTVRCAPDILFSYSMPAVSVRDKSIFVSVIDCAGRDEAHSLSQYDENYVTNMSSLLNKYLSDGYSVTLSSFCKEEGDENGISKIIERLDKSYDQNVRIINYNGTNHEEVVKAIASSQLVVATRFHATILALAAGRPVIPIIYSDKTKNVLDDIGFHGTVFDLRSDNEWIIDNTSCSNYHITQEIKNASKIHFIKLDDNIWE